MLRVHGFYGHVRRNDLRAAAMFAGFIVAFQAIAAVALALPLTFLDVVHAPYFPVRYWNRYGLCVFGIGIALFALRLRRHVATVRVSAGYREVDRRSHPRLVNIVETLAIAAGLPLPKVGVIDSPARNAFACGLGAGSAVVVVTRGLLESLDDDELAAVAAHEIAHIRNADIRLMAAANVLLEILLWVQKLNLLRISNWRRAIVAVLLPPLMILALAGGLISNLAVILGRVSRLLIASSRELIADAEAVRLTQAPEALISALRKIEGRSIVAGLDPRLDAMMIDGATAGPYADHPPVAERISVLARLANLPVAPASASFGRRRPPTAADLLSPSRRLFERVNEGAKENLFGVTPQARRVMQVGFGLLIALMIWGMWQTRRTMAEWDTRYAGVIAAGQRARTEIDRLAALTPSQARCFQTDIYSVGDRGLHALRSPQPERVESYVTGKQPGSSDIVIERYLAARIMSIRAIEVRDPAGRDQARLDYVRTRKILMEVVHRFFGEPGLDLMQRSYDSPDDRAILAALRAGREAGTLSFAPTEDRLRGEVDFLVASPDEFIPCVARVPRSNDVSLKRKRGAPAQTKADSLKT